MFAEQKIEILIDVTKTKINTKHSGSYFRAIYGYGLYKLEDVIRCNRKIEK